MVAQRAGIAFLVATLLVSASGCLAGKTKSLSAQNQSLTERNEVLAAQLESLKAHTDNIEDQLLRVEEELALNEGRSGIDRERLAALRAARLGTTGQTPVATPLPGLAPHTEARLARVSERYGNLAFGPGRGVSKLGVDILFGQGEDQLKPGAADALREVAAMLESEDGVNLKVLVVGHTDDQQVAKKPGRERFTDNFGLSAARAHRVADALQQFGVASERIGIAGYGPHQPVAPNATEEDRRKNRRVEIFIMAQEVPVIGWTESTLGLY